MSDNNNQIPTPPAFPKGILKKARKPSVPVYVKPSTPTKNDSVIEFMDVHVPVPEPEESTVDEASTSKPRLGEPKPLLASEYSKVAIRPIIKDRTINLSVRSI